MTNLEREYTIPLRRFWVNVPKYRRSARAINAIKTFIAKHMKVTERDVNNVKLDVYLNNEIWYRGTDNPPSKVKVKAVKEGEIVKVTLSEVPAYVKFLQAKHAKLHKKSEKPVAGINTGFFKNSLPGFIAAALLTEQII